MRPNPEETADLITFTEEILNGKLHFLCSDHIVITACFIFNEGHQFFTGSLTDSLRSRNTLRIWSHLRNKSVMENFIFVH